MPVRFLVTGFGHFAGVQCNPTQQLVEWLKTEHQHRLPQFPGCKAFSSSSTADETLRSASSAHTRTHVPVGSAHDDFQVLSCTVLEVSAEAVAIFLQEQQRILSGACSSCDGQPIILLHLGVDTQRTCLNLELQAYNNACFRCPDQAGWQPDNIIIEEGSGLSVNSTRCTSLPLQQIAAELQAAGFDCQVSQDAGRFVCNYTYHRSLQLAASLGQQQQQQEEAPQAAVGSASHHNNRSSCSCDTTQAASSSSGSEGDSAAQQGSNDNQLVHASPAAEAATSAADICAKSLCYSLFVHVPSFAAISEAKQRQFLLELMCCINKHMGREPWITQ